MSWESLTPKGNNLKRYRPKLVLNVHSRIESWSKGRRRRRISYHIAAITPGLCISFERSNNWINFEVVAIAGPHGRIIDFEAFIANP